MKGAIASGYIGTRSIGRPVDRNWFEVELFSTNKNGEWDSAPQTTCEHAHVVALKDSLQTPPTTRGLVPLYCMDCDETWWEDVAKIKGSPWEVKRRA